MKVLPDCSVPGHGEIFVVGDVASLAGRDGRPLPGLAAVAAQQGKYVAKVIAARIAGRSSPGPFRYRDLGTLAMIGRSRAVAILAASSSAAFRPGCFGRWCTSFCWQGFATASWSI